MNITKKVESIVISNNKLKVVLTFAISKLLNIIYTGPLSFIKLKNFKKKFQINKNKVLVKTLLCGVCGSDRKIISFDYSVNSTAFPETKRYNQKETFLGHELVGEVYQIGKNVKNLKKGDRVILDSVNRHDHQLNNNIFGGWTNFFVRNENQLFKISKKLKFEQAILLEPLACSLNAVLEANIKKDKKNVLIVGSGIIGLGIYVFLKYFFNNLNITFLTKEEMPFTFLKKNKKINIIYNENIVEKTSKILKTDVKKFLLTKITSSGFDYIFECSGDKKILNRIIKICNFNSKIILNGMIMHKSKFDLTPLWIRNIKILSTNGYKNSYKFNKIPKTFKFIQSLILKRKINTEFIKVKKFNIKSWDLALKNKEKNIVKNALMF